jgi:hypothetical protein
MNFWQPKKITAFPWLSYSLGTQRKYELPELVLYQASCQSMNSVKFDLHLHAIKNFSSETFPLVCWLDSRKNLVHYYIKFSFGERASLHLQRQRRNSLKLKKPRTK